MPDLTQDQKDRFRRDGFLILENAVTEDQRAAMRSVFDGWVEESRGHADDFGETLDGRARFDLEPGHTADTPALRRVQSPEEISDDYNAVMREGQFVDWVADLIGPAIRFHHGKVNSKLPGAATQVKFHQDFTFEPMSNDDMITALVFLDDVTDENGPLEVVPGTHTGPLYSLWHGGVFTGVVDDTVTEAHRKNVQTCTGPAGSRLPDACPAAARFGTEHVGHAAHALYRHVLRRGCGRVEPEHLPSRLNHALVRARNRAEYVARPTKWKCPKCPR